MNTRTALALIGISVAQLCVACASSTPRVSAPSASVTTADDGLDQLSDEQIARKLMDVVGAGALGKQVADSMLETFRNTPNMPPEIVDRFKQNMHVEELTDIVVGIYMKHYDRAVMTAAIRFYQSEPGHKLVTELPAVTAECMEAGKAWGERVANITLEQLRAAQQ